MVATVPAEVSAVCARAQLLSTALCGWLSRDDLPLRLNMRPGTSSRAQMQGRRVFEYSVIPRRRLAAAYQQAYAFNARCAPWRPAFILETPSGSFIAHSRLNL
jgi:hypothetical protein